MANLRKIQRGSAMGRGLNRVLRFGVRRGLRSLEVHPEYFRRQLAEKHGLWGPNLNRMHDVPLEQLVAIAEKLIPDAARLALAEGPGFGLGDTITWRPAARVIPAITRRSLSRRCIIGC